MNENWIGAAKVKYQGYNGVLFRSKDDPTVWRWRNNVFYAESGKSAVEAIETLELTPKKRQTLYCLLIVYGMKDQEE